MPCRLIEEEIQELSHYADQINKKLLSINSTDTNKESDINNSSSNDSVDLDNLFAFLSDVTLSSKSNPVLEEISDKMDNLVQDLTEEVRNIKKFQRYMCTKTAVYKDNLFGRKL